MKLRYSNTGFTLIELMAIVVIVAILTVIAYPAYQKSVIKANRAEAKSYLMDMAQKEHLYFNDARTYVDTEADLKVERPDRVAKNYDIVFDVHTVPPPMTFTISADPNSSLQQGDGTLSISNTGKAVRELSDGTQEAW